MYIPILLLLALLYSLYYRDYKILGLSLQALPFWEFPWPRLALGQPSHASAATACFVCSATK